MALVQCDFAQHILVAPQRHRLDEDQALSVKTCQYRLHGHRHHRAALLGRRNLRQLRLFPQYQHHLPENTPVGTTMQVRTVLERWRITWY